MNQEKEKQVRLLAFGKEVVLVEVMGKPLMDGTGNLRVSYRWPVEEGGVKVYGSVDVNSPRWRESSS